MAHTVNIELKYNAAAQASKEFADLFKRDIEYCMKRFRVNLKFGEGDTSSSGFNYRFIVVNNSDFENKEYCDSLKNLNTDVNSTFLLILNPVKSRGIPLSQQKHISFSFWDQVVETAEIRFFKRNDKETQHLYWERITDIVIEITDKIHKHDEKQGFVYLAQTDDSQTQDRDNIKRDLNDLGYSIIPSTQLSANFDESIVQINDALGKSKLIIHLIPANYSDYFESKSISIVEHQCNLSAQFIQESSQKSKRIIWIPSDYDVVDEKNQIFIEKIQRELDLSQNTLVLKVSLEDLKKIYRKILAGDEVTNAGQESLPDLYMIADNENLDVISSIGNEAKAAGLKFGKNFNGISYNEHLRYLASAQVVVVNYTLENQQWINVKVHDILKSPGLEISTPNKKLVLIKNAKDLNTNHFEQYFNEVHVVEAADIKLNLK